MKLLSSWPAWCSALTLLIGASAAACSDGKKVRCGEGTARSGRECLPFFDRIECGEGTVRVEDECRPSGRNLSCADGTHEENGQCVPNDVITCAEGTRLENGACVPDGPGLVCADGTTEVNGECVPDGPGLVCADGTTEVNGECVPDDSLSCGEGTEEVDGACVPSFPRLECGDGTHLENGFCVTDGETITCGEGTVLEEGACMPDGELIMCGPGTQEVLGMCVPSVVGCGPDTHQSEGLCLPDETQWVWLPLAEDTPLSISQGFHGQLSHTGYVVFAVDFPLTLGTTVVAARSGRVHRVKEDSNTGCGDASCIEDANFVVIDHGDGTFANYVHLQFEGALVDVGDEVCAGQPIARSGNTGFSTGPHLHFAVEDAFRRTMPLRFFELEDVGGVPFASQELTSGNALIQCEAVPPAADCPERLFAFRGVELDAGFPCARATKDQLYTITGRSLSPDGVVIIGVNNVVTEEWRFECVEPDAQRRFTYPLRWDAATHTGDHSFIIVSHASTNNGCQGGPSFTGWDRAPRVELDPAP